MFQEQNAKMNNELVVLSKALFCAFLRHRNAAVFLKRRKERGKELKLSRMSWKRDFEATSHKAGLCRVAD